MPRVASPSTIPTVALDVFPSHMRAGKRDGALFRLLTRVIPRHTLTLVHYEAHMAWVRWSRRNAGRSFAGRRGLLINVGSGKRGKAGWVNVDADRLPGVDVVWDCRRSLPFDDGSARGIFTEHFVEHVDYTEELPLFLSECHRVLEAGGVLRIIVPDAGRYMRAYCEPGWDELATIRPLHGDRIDAYFNCQYHTKMELLNVVFRQGGQHKYAHDLESLTYVLQKFGFTTVRRQEFGSGLLPDLCIDSPRRATESLYVEAVR